MSVFWSNGYANVTLVFLYVYANNYKLSFSFPLYALLNEVNFILVIIKKILLSFLELKTEIAR